VRFIKEIPKNSHGQKKSNSTEENNPDFDKGGKASKSRTLGGGQAFPREVIT